MGFSMVTKAIGFESLDGVQVPAPITIAPRIPVTTAVSFMQIEVNPPGPVTILTVDEVA
jgi:hypothetical protein